MKKNKSIYITFIIIETLLIIFLSTFLYLKWYVPHNKELTLKNSIKAISFDSTNKLIEDIQNNDEIKLPVVNNDILNNSSWVNYGDNTIIVFKDGYFVWYGDSDLSSDDCLMGQFSYYEGKDAFNLLKEVTDEDINQTEIDSVLILDIVSIKIGGEETLEDKQSKYLFGYHQDEIMSFIDISSYSEYTFLEVESE